MSNASQAFHAGEIAVQERAGERAIAEHHAPMIRDRLTGGARGFLESQGVIAVGVAAPNGSLWTSLWCGEAGLARADALGQRVQLQWPAESATADPVRPIVRAGDPLALLVIDFARRGRLRINGLVRSVDDRGIDVMIRETFGNCIKYIQRRHRVLGPPNAIVSRVERGNTIDAARAELIARTDTLFVTSVHRERGLDVSHRGGRPGFVHLIDDRNLRIPDYQGNSLFQTLGNFEVDPRAGIALIDFDKGSVLSLTGTASAHFGAEHPEHPTGGTGRYWSFRVDSWVEFPLPSTMRWTLVEPSPYNP